MERLTKVMDKYLKEAIADLDKKKVLTLTINKEWFDKIVSGNKEVSGVPTGKSASRKR